MSKFAWITLATNDSYCLGALVLAYSLKRVSTAHQLAVLITPGVSNAMREKLGSVFDVVREVNVLDSQDTANLALLSRPELGITFTKLHCWTLVQFEKCVFLDADTLVLQNCDELFEREELSAAPDVGWPDCFNSGVFVFRPSQDTYSKLIDFAITKGSFDGGDQGLLNLFFSDWAHKDIAKHLPFIYNTCSTACYSYLPAFKQFGDNVKILHFIGSGKPWLQNFDSKSGRVHTSKESEHIAKYLQYWWTIFFDQVHSNLSSEMTLSSRWLTVNSPQGCGNGPFIPISLFLGSSVTNQIDINSVSNSISSIVVNNFSPVYDPWEDFKIQMPAMPCSDQVNNNQNSNRSRTETNSSLKQSTDSIRTVIKHPSDNLIEIQTKTALATEHLQLPEPLHEEKQPQNHHHVQLPKDLQYHKHDSIKSPEISQSGTARVNSDRSSINCVSVPEQLPIIGEDDVQNTSVNCERVVEPDEAGIAGALAHVTLGEYKSPEQESYEHHVRRQCWEAGNIDYMGKDSFDNIWRRISKTLETPNEPVVVTSQPAVAPSTTTDPKLEAKSAAEVKPEAKVDETVEEETVKIQERVTTTKTPDGKTIMTKVITLPGQEIEEIEEETLETVGGETKTNKTKSSVIKAPFPVSKVGGKEVAIKGDLKLGETQTDFDAETNTTVVTKRLEKGYEQTFTTVLPDGRTKTQTKTFFDPIDVPGDEEEEEIEEYEEIHTSSATKSTTTSSGNNIPSDVQKPAGGPPPSKETTAAQTTKVTETQAKTTENKTTVEQQQTKDQQKNTKEQTVVKTIPKGKQEITTTVNPDGKSQTTTRTIFNPDEEEETEEYEETHLFEPGQKKKTTTTTTSGGKPKPEQPKVPAKTSQVTTVAVPSTKNPSDNVLARKVVTKGDEEIEITEEHTETEFSPTKKTTKTTSLHQVDPLAPKLDPKGKTTVTQVVIPGSENKVVSCSNDSKDSSGKQILSKKNPSGTQEITKTTSADGKKTSVQVTTTMNPEELNIEETETTNIIGDKTITTTRTEVPIPGKKTVKVTPGPTIVTKGPKTTTTTTTTIQPVGEDKITVTKKKVDKGLETTTRTETKDGKTKKETHTQFEPIFHPPVSDDEEIEEYEERTETHAPVKTKTTSTTRGPAPGAPKPKVSIPMQPGTPSITEATPSSTSPSLGNPINSAGLQVTLAQPETPPATAAKKKVASPTAPSSDASSKAKEVVAPVAPVPPPRKKETNAAKKSIAKTDTTKK